MHAIDHASFRPTMLEKQVTQTENELSVNILPESTRKVQDLNIIQEELHSGDFSHSRTMNTKDLKNLLVPITTEPRTLKEVK